jgi:hypothetical protein
MIIHEHEDIANADILDMVADRDYIHKPYLEDSLIEKIIEDKTNVAIDLINHFFICKGELNLLKREDYGVIFNVEDYCNEDLSYRDKASFVTIHNKLTKRALQVRSVSSELSITLTMFNDFKLSNDGTISKSSTGVLGATVTISELCSFHLLGKLFDFLYDGNIDLSTKPSGITVH